MPEIPDTNCPFSEPDFDPYSRDDCKRVLVFGIGELFWTVFGNGQDLHVSSHSYFFPVFTWVERCYSSHHPAFLVFHGDCPLTVLEDKMALFMIKSSPPTSALDSVPAGTSRTCSIYSFLSLMSSTSPSSPATWKHAQASPRYLPLTQHFPFALPPSFPFALSLAKEPRSLGNSILHQSLHTPRHSSPVPTAPL